MLADRAALMCRHPAIGSHPSAVHGSPSSHAPGAGVCSQTPDGEHVSVVHATPSSQIDASTAQRFQLTIDARTSRSRPSRSVLPGPGFVS
jgi:hypothetical protein